MMELVKKEIHMNRQKGSTVSQITLDDDFIVPDTLDDVARILLDHGEIQIETARRQGEKETVQGKLLFRILYRQEEGGLQALGGEIPFEEVMNVPGLEEHDDVQVTWTLEDLSTSMIHSRKLNIKAVVTLEVRVESLCDAEAATDVETDDTEAEVLRHTVNVAAIAVRRKDTYRIREDIQVSGNKPNAEKILWDEMRLRGVTIRPLDGMLHLEGELLVFLIYAGEGEHTPVQWLEESIPFSGEVDLAESEEEMIPDVGVRILHRGVEMKPDYDGEMREFSVDAVLELDMKLYREERVELLSDVYSTGCEIHAEQGEACFDRLLTHNVCKTRIGEQISLGKPERILQICHSSGSVKLDEARPEEDGLHLEGVLDLRLLYLTDDDAEPVGTAGQVLPFHCVAGADGIREDSVWQIHLSLEQLTAVMLGGGQVEVKAVISAELLVLQPIKEPVVTAIETEPLDLQKLQEMPGIVGYVVQKGDSLWNIAKKFHTTVDNVCEINELTERAVREGDRLILVKEIK